MPLYEYECDACGQRFERIQKFSDPLVESCPKCSGRVRKLLSSPAIQFKGSGWYITDYAKKGSGGGDGGAKAAGGESKSETTADKPADKPADKADSSSSTPKSE
jgi:putative FmdB family regulatory protein